MLRNDNMKKITITVTDFRQPEKNTLAKLAKHLGRLC
jgi:hypothetical protein